MPKILITGASHAIVPIIMEAKKMGYYVITVGNNRGGLGHKYSDKSVLIDYSDKEAVLDLAKKENVVGICSGANDFAALSSAYASAKLGLIGHDSYKTSKIIHHKDKFRQFAKSNSILTPFFLSITGVKDIDLHLSEFSYPVIIKPTDLTGGKGISIANNKQELIAGIRHAFSLTREKNIVVEEFINGTKHGLSTFLVNGKVKFQFSDDEHYFLNKFLVSGASTPNNLEDTIITKLIEDVEKIAKTLHLCDGIFHVQFIVKNKTPYIIEVCRRTPGDLYIKLVELATNFNLSKFILKSSLGLDCSNIKQHINKGFFTRHCIMSKSEGLVSNIEYDKSILENIIEKNIWWKKGDIIENKLTQKLGIIFLQYASEEEMNQKSKNLQELVKVKIN